MMSNVRAPCHNYNLLRINESQYPQRKTPYCGCEQ
jgi:hypothetical protein